MLKGLKMKKILLFASLFVSMSVLSACSDMKKSLGIENSAPNEFMVTTRAPLTLPPDFDLRPVSKEGVASPAIASQPAEFSEGEQALLSKLR